MEGGTELLSFGGQVSYMLNTSSLRSSIIRSYRAMQCHQAATRVSTGMLLCEKFAKPVEAEQGAVSLASGCFCGLASIFTGHDDGRAAAE